LADTIARRFALSAALTVAGTLALVLLFNQLAGVWASERLERSGLLNEVADMSRIIETAPPSLRDTLAAAASSPGKRIEWVAAGSELSASLENNQEPQEHAAASVVAAITQHTVKAWEVPQRHPVDADRNSVLSYPYALAVRLTDGSWIIFAAPKRIWGLGRAQRWALWLLFVGIAISVTTAFAARQFAIPVKQLAAAVREFGVNTRAPPIAETGPRELRQVIRTFNEMQAQIQQFISHRTTMLAAISHDLRTPLTRMRLRGELIEDPAQQGRLFRDVDEMQAMIDGALAFFRDDAEAESATVFDLANVLTTITNDCADQSIDVRYVGPVHVPYKGRPFALKRAFANLVENANKYASAPEIHLECGTRALEVMVIDHGPGIPEEMLPKVFMPYFRVERSRNRNTGGVGLGLTVAQAIVHAHGGTIALTNRQVGGLEVLVTLPLAREG
jgi:signal transduction histidine kinase